MAVIAAAIVLTEIQEVLMPRTQLACSRNLTAESAFTVLAIARALKAKGKDVVELEIGDSPFPSTPHAKRAGIRAIEENETGYCPSLGCPSFRAAAARFVSAEFGYSVTAENIVVGSGAKPFEQFFAEAVLDPGDGVLVFSPQFPTYVPNLERRGARAVLVPLKVENEFRPSAEDVRRFLATDPRPRAIMLNSPHNPTGGVATRDDLAAIAEVVRGTELMVFSDEPYCHMVWSGRHASILAEPGMLEHTVAAYTFSKSYSMSGWRIGFAVAAPAVVDAIGKLINTSASCSPPLAQRAAQAALEHDTETRDDYMERFRRKVDRLCDGLERVDGFRVAARPARFMSSRTCERSATACKSPRTAWRSICWKGPTTTSAWPAWAANVSARPAGLLAVQLRRARRAHRPGDGVSCLGRSSAAIEFVRYLEANPQYVLREPYGGRARRLSRSGAESLDHERRRSPPTRARSSRARPRDPPDRWAAAVRHLRRVDPHLRAIIDRIGPCRLEPHPDRFGALVRSIISQQISTKAAASINARLVAIGGEPTSRRD